MEDKRRDPVFDIMKGLAIIFVIMYHCRLSGVNFRIVEMFHVPLFFIISGYFAKNVCLSYFFKKQAKCEVIPYIFCFLLMLLLASCFEWFVDVEVIPVVVKSYTLGMGCVVEFFEGTMKEVTIGPFWFLLALLWVRLLWALLCKVGTEVARGTIIAFLSIGCVFFAYKYTVNYWSIMSSFGALGFYYAGYLIRKYDFLHSGKGLKFFLICLILFFYCVTFSKIDINMRIYNAYYIIDLLGCLGAFFLLYSMINKFQSIKSKVMDVLNFIGRYSLVAFCIHSIDQCLNVHWLPLKIYSVFGNGIEDRLTVFGIRFMIVLIGTYLVSRSHFIKEKIFFIK